MAAMTKAPHPVTRDLKVTEMMCSECEKIIADGLSALEGVIKVESNWRENRVVVTYDLHQTRIQEVEELLTEIDYPPDDSFMSRKKRDWTHFTEQNGYMLI